MPRIQTTRLGFSTQPSLSFYFLSPFSSSFFFSFFLFLTSSSSSPFFLFLLLFLFLSLLPNYFFQAEAILALRLGRLTALEEKKLQDEQAELAREIGNFPLFVFHSLCFDFLNFSLLYCTILYFTVLQFISFHFTCRKW